MKSSGLAQVVFYTCCRLRAGSAAACSILVPSSDWCLCSKCPSTISIHNLSVSIRPPVYLCVTSSTIHLSFLPLCLNVSLSLSLYLHIDLTCRSLKAFSAFGLFLSGRWKISLWVCVYETLATTKDCMRSRARTTCTRGNQSYFRWKGINFKSTFIYMGKWVTCSLNFIKWGLKRSLFEMRNEQRRTPITLTAERHSWTQEGQQTMNWMDLKFRQGSSLEQFCPWIACRCKTTFKDIPLIYTAIKHYPVGKLKKRQKSSVDLITNSLPGPNRAELPFN